MIQETSSLFKKIFYISAGILSFSSILVGCTTIQDSTQQDNKTQSEKHDQGNGNIKGDDDTPEFLSYKLKKIYTCIGF